jgi:hypothetical protein
MSYKSEYKSLNIAAPEVRAALKAAVEETSAMFEKPGWTLIDNEELVASGKAFVKIRMHEANNEKFPVILKNPGTASGSYDIGLRVSSDDEKEMGCDFVYDRYLSDVVNAWGEKANSLNGLTVAAQARHMSGMDDMPLPQFITETCKDPVTNEPLTWQDFMDMEQAIELDTTDHPLAQLA